MNTVADTQIVQMDSITRDPKFQVRSQLDLKLVRQYATAMSNGADFPPIHLGKVKDALIIVDGWHRHAALHSLGEREIEAKVTSMTQSEALIASALANTKHGKPLKPSERRSVFKNFIRGKGHKKEDGNLMTYREIAESLGGHVGHTTIYNWMKKDFPKVFKAMGVEVERGKGNGEPPPIDVETEYYKESQLAFTDTLNLFKLLTNPENRYEIIQQVEKGLAEMKTYKHYAADF